MGIRHQGSLTNHDAPASKSGPVPKLSSSRRHRKVCRDDTDNSGMPKLRRRVWCQRISDNTSREELKPNSRREPMRRTVWKNRNRSVTFVVREHGLPCQKRETRSAVLHERVAWQKESTSRVKTTRFG